MGKYSVLINGRNFFFELDDKPPGKKGGFYVWVISVAEDERNAIQNAINIVENLPKIVRLRALYPRENNGALVVAERVLPESQWKRGFDGQSGIVFYFNDED